MIRMKDNQRKRAKTLPGIETYFGITLMETLRSKKENREVPPVIMDTFYTNKADGVLNTLNIRADRFDIGIEETERLGEYKRRKSEHLKKAGAGAPDPNEENVPSVIG